MAVRINADTVTGGAVVTADATGILELQAAGTTQVTIATTGTNIVALGINTTPTTNYDLDVSGGACANNTAVSASTIDCTTGNYFTKTAVGALTWVFSNPPSTRNYMMVLALTNGGAGAQTWPASVKWPGAVAPTLTASGIDMLVFVTDNAGTSWRGSSLLNYSA